MLSSVSVMRGRVLATAASIVSWLFSQPLVPRNVAIAALASGVSRHTRNTMSSASFFFSTFVGLVRFVISNLLWLAKRKPAKCRLLWLGLVNGLAVVVLVGKL